MMERLVVVILRTTHEVTRPLLDKKRKKKKLHNCLSAENNRNRVEGDKCRGRRMGKKLKINSTFSVVSGMSSDLVEHYPTSLLTVDPLLELQ